MFEQGDFEKSSLSQLKNQSEAEIQASRFYHYDDDADNRWPAIELLCAYVT